MKDRRNEKLQQQDTMECATAENVNAQLLSINQRLVKHFENQQVCQLNQEYFSIMAERISLLSLNDSMAVYSLLAPIYVKSKELCEKYNFMHERKEI